MDVVRESTGKYLKSPRIIIHSMLRVALNVRACLTSELCFKCVTNKFMSSFCQLLFIQYCIYEHTSVSHCSLNFDAPSVGYGFSSIMLVLEDCQRRSVKVHEKCLNLLR